MPQLLEDPIEPIEQAIIEQLRSDLDPSDAAIEAFPDSVEDWRRPRGSARIYVGFQRETLEPPPHQNFDTLKFQQGRTLDFLITISVKSLRREATGVYALMRKIRRSLAGFRPLPDRRALYQTTSGFSDYNAEGFWIYNMTFVINYPYVRAADS
ncbi:MAG: Gp37 family protein [Cyanobacteria bacterium P01_H01_bin.121]